MTARVFNKHHANVPANAVYIIRAIEALTPGSPL